MRHAAAIATRAFFHERVLTLCTLLGLAAILAPLLILFGLKSGVVTALRERLERDPRIRVLQPVGQGAYDAAWFTALRRQPGTGFLIPSTRFLAATILLRDPARPNAESLAAELVPSGPGDPLLTAIESGAIAAQPLGHDLHVAVSRAVADRLHIAPGARTEGRIGRLLENQPQAMTLGVTIDSILPASAADRALVFVPLRFLEAAEDYREGFAVPALGAAGQTRPGGERRYASFRLYAGSIDAVAGLRDWLAARGVQSVTHLGEIETVQRLDYDLGRLFLVLAGLGAAGFLLSLSLGLWASIVRQRRALSLLRLLGFPAASIALFPVVQGLWAALLSLGLAAAATFAARPVIERLMASSLPQGGHIFRLRAADLAYAVLATCLCTVMAAALGGAGAARIAPSEGLRDD